MPIYEYRRPDGSRFELIQKFSDEALTEDPETGVPVQRVLSAPAIHFKGSGFYNTDYSSKRRGTEGSDSKDPSSEKSGSSEKSSSESSGSGSGGDSKSSGKDSGSKSGSSGSTSKAGSASD
ncbi:MAG: FmdB family zinc ribbon protein [Solirubrobacterales bacterium]